MLPSRKLSIHAHPPRREDWRYPVPNQKKLLHWGSQPQDLDFGGLRTAVVTRGGGGGQWLRVSGKTGCRRRLVPKLPEAHRCVKDNLTDEQQQPPSLAHSHHPFRENVFFPLSSPTWRIPFASLSPVSFWMQDGENGYRGARMSNIRRKREGTKPKGLCAGLWGTFLVKLRVRYKSSFRLGEKGCFFS